MREKVAAIRERLPEQIKDPTIQRFDVAALPIATYAVGSNLPSDVTRRMVEDDLKPLLGQIDGVAAVEVNGGEVRELQVDLDPRRLEALNLPLTEVAAKLAADNLDVPGGQIKRDGKAVSLRTQGQYQSAAEIENVILRSAGGSTVRVKDVGVVVDGYEDRLSTTRLNGADAVSFSVRKQSGANTVDVQDKIDAALAKAAPGFPQLQIKTVHTDAEAIQENVRDVRGHIIFGGIMAVLVIFVFMRDWRSTLITALALPTSVIATFFFMYVVGFTINMMTLMALSLVIGILIDDAVVVRENIYRHMEHGEDPMTAAQRGTSEIGLAVMATTFTILAVFLPVGFMTGLVGQFFKSFALTIAFAVVDLAAGRVHARPDAVVALRAVHPARRAHAHARSAASSKRVGALLRPPRSAVSPPARLGDRAPLEDGRDGHGGVLRQHVDARHHRHRVRAGRRPRRVRGQRRSAAGHVVRADGRPTSPRSRQTIKAHARGAADLLDGRRRGQPDEGGAARQGRQEARRASAACWRSRTTCARGSRPSRCSR